MKQCKLYCVAKQAKDMNANTWYNVQLDTSTDTSIATVDSDNVITIQESGFYAVSCKAHFGIAGNCTAQMYINVNSVTEQQEYNHNAGSLAGQVFLTSALTMFLSKGDTIKMMIIQDGSVIGGLYGAGADSHIWLVQLQK